MKHLLILLAAVIVLTSCSSNGNYANKAATDSIVDVPADTLAADNDLNQSRWLIERIVYADNEAVRPADYGVTINQNITFYADGTFRINTNCNSFDGNYALKGDTLTLSDASWTELACDHMETEEALREVLPHVNRIDYTSDSTACIQTSNYGKRIELRRAPSIVNNGNRNHNNDI